MPAQAEKTIGIIGGLGPQATADFYHRVICHTPATSDQDHLHVLIDSNPKTPNRNLAIAGQGPCPGDTLRQSALRLQAAGADFLVMPCNTAHAFKDWIINAVDIPFIDIIDETVAHIQCLNHQEAHQEKWQPAHHRNIHIKKVALLATDGCLQSRLYHNALEAEGLATLCIDQSKQQHFMELIYAIKATGVTAEIKDQMMAMAQHLIGFGAQAVIAGCTEVPLVLSQGDLPVPLIDSTDILAKRCVHYASAIP